MPYKGSNKQKDYQRKWYQRKKAGLPTRTTKLLTNEERLQRRRKSSNSSSKKIRKIRKIKIQHKFGKKCVICSDDYYLQLHRKDGTLHRSPTSMTNVQFEELINGDDYIQFCFNCHKAIHWLMKYLKMTWEEIEPKLWILEVAGVIKNKYHS